MLNPKAEKKWFWIIIGLGLATRLAASVLNKGYLALDDYYILFFSVPAQSESLALVDTIQSVPEIRSLVPDFIIRVFAKTAYWLGFQDPLSQIQFLFACLGILSIVTVFTGYNLLKFLYTPKGLRTEKRENYKDWIPLSGAFLLSLHFLMPFISTRSLIESMSAPFLLGSAFYFSKYYVLKVKKYLFYSLLLLSISCLFRFQVGVCAIAIFAFVLYDGWKKKDWKDLGYFFVFSVFLFILTGLPDLIFRGSLHSSLISYFRYNLDHSAEYGTSPWYTYLPTVIGVSMLPLLIGKYDGFEWKKIYKELIPVSLFSGIFFVSHSLIPHKEERFLLPIFPLLLLLLSPLAAYWWAKEHRRMSIRRSIFFLVNFILLSLLSFFTIQSNSIDLVRYLHSHKEIKQLYVYKDSIPHLPVSYAYRDPLERYESIESLDEENQPKIPGFDPYTACSSAFVVRKDYVVGGQYPEAPWDLIATFRSSPLEEFAVSLNPNKNKRRSSLYLYKFKLCKDEVVSPQNHLGTVDL
ncbi:hypothetical protein [Leptospira sarikeiensis]|uniref:Mannosyltransferase n=1 Tax=Leptospira sarikeiensis TaxID=2484943 RepID=A0A4V3JR83_9LEPT|nr:hypothetical protein [Leptospira sarikeiensis]TGL59015.1 hypothetical protein EHQ64_16670 [Leptospira sarikeiensis]